MGRNFCVFIGITALVLAIVGYDFLHRPGTLFRLEMMRAAMPGTPLPDAMSAFQAKGFSCRDAEVAPPPSATRVVLCFRYDSGARAPNGAGNRALLTATDGKIARATVGPCGFLESQTCEQVGALQHQNALGELNHE